MTAHVDADVVDRQIAHVVSLLGEIEAAVERHRAVATDDRVVALLERLRGATVAQREAWLARLGDVEIHGATAAPRATGRARSSADPTGDLEGVVGAVAAAAVGYTRLYTTARLMFDAPTCDLAAGHLRAWVEAVHVVTWLLPDVVGREVTASDGLSCRCGCPACSVGACLCVRNSTDTASHAWNTGTPFGSRGLPAPDPVETTLDRWSLASLAPQRGVVLTAAPRPGSPLAAAGIERGDRILEIDGVAVRSNPDIQDALTAHDPGQEVHVQVERASGHVAEVVIQRPTA